MIYSRFGIKLTLLSKQQEGSGRLTVQATSEGTGDVRPYDVGDLKASGGFAEIDEAVAMLPWKIDQKKAKRDE